MYHGTYLQLLYLESNNININLLKGNTLELWLSSCTIVNT